MFNILLIEDDKVQRLLYEKALKDELNINFEFAKNYLEAMSLISLKSYDLYLIDLNLEGYSGLDILKFLQKEQAIENRVVVVSASNELEDQLACYELGAANFIQKPINISLLKAIVKKNIRAIDSSTKDVFVFKKIVLDIHKRQCYLNLEAEKRIVNLTATQFSFLYYLLKNVDRVVDKDDLAIFARSGDRSMSRKAIEMQISELRKKLKPLDIIQSKRGHGYIIEYKSVN